jgi:heme-degrading monooxygenase HmoA
MIRTMLRLAVAPGEAEGLVDTFRRLEILETSIAQDGCLSTEIAISDNRSEAVVTATWSDRAAYGRWTSRTDRGAHSAEISRHLRDPLTAETVGLIYDVGHRPEFV